MLLTVDAFCLNYEAEAIIIIFHTFVLCSLISFHKDKENPSGPLINLKNKHDFSYQGPDLKLSRQGCLAIHR